MDIETTLTKKITNMKLVQQPMMQKLSGAKLVQFLTPTSQINQSHVRWSEGKAIFIQAEN